MLGPFHSLLLLSLLWVFVKSFGFPGPITTSFTLGLLAFGSIPFTTFLLWAPSARFCFLFISYDSHGLTTSSFRASSTCFAFFEATYYLMGLWTTIPAILAQWSLFYYFLPPPLSYCWTSFAIGPFCQKRASTHSFYKYVTSKQLNHFFFFLRR